MDVVGWICFVTEYLVVQASHVCVWKRGAVVLINCDLKTAREDILDVLNSPTISQPMPMGSAPMSDCVCGEMEVENATNIGSYRSLSRFLQIIRC